MIYRKRKWKYELGETLSHSSKIVGLDIQTSYGRIALDGTITIYKGYAWDGGSGPAIDTKNSQTGSMLHDFLYQLMREMLLSVEWRNVADRLLQEVLIEYGVSKVRAGWWYTAVNSFAKRAATPVKKNEWIEVLPVAKVAA